jgi:hypothetical protein
VFLIGMGALQSNEVLLKFVVGGRGSEVAVRPIKC